MKHYESTELSSSELQQLLKDVYELELSRGVSITISPSANTKAVTFYVTMTGLNNEWSDMLHMSFNDGIMSHIGWRNKFVLMLT